MVAFAALDTKCFASFSPGDLVVDANGPGPGQYDVSLALEAELKSCVVEMVILIDY